MKRFKEEILCAAIWYDDGVVYPHQEIYNIPSGFVICGYRHHNIIGAFSKENTHKYKKKQGFLTSFGVFVDRREAAIVAYNSGQIKEKKKFLYSEDLY